MYGEFFVTSFLCLILPLESHTKPVLYIFLHVCYLWLLVMTRLSVCPLGSSLSLLISLSWRALRLLSRAASSSSSSFLANLWETQKERKTFPQFRNFKGNTPTNWSVIITAAKSGRLRHVFFPSFSVLSSWPVSCAAPSSSYRSCSFHKLIKSRSGAPV